MIEEPLRRWEGVEADELAERWGCAAVHLFARLGSTNDVARRLAAEGAPAGTVVLAEEQLAGRGRAGRQWSSPPGLGLWFSVVARPAPAADPGPLPLQVGLAVAGALDRFLPRGMIRIKWPNDLVAADGRKLGGILCESAWEGERVSVVVAGVGMNLLHRADDFPASIRERATSLAQIAAGDLRRLEVATSVVSAVVDRLRSPGLLEPGAVEELGRRDPFFGRDVVVTEPVSGAAVARGRVLGVAPDGSLLLRSDAGVLRAIRSGTLRLPEDGS